MRNIVLVLAALVWISAGTAGAEEPLNWSGKVKIESIEVSDVNAEGVWLSFTSPPNADHTCSIQTGQYMLGGGAANIARMFELATSAYQDARDVTVYWGGACSGGGTSGYPVLLGLTAWAEAPKPAPSCETAGPQAPRDIDHSSGRNPVAFSPAPPAGDLRLCDIHFHKNAEHKSAGYPTLAGEGDHKGYVCKGHEPKAQAQGDHDHADHETAGCKGIAVGDTIEVHWVFTTCEVEPGPTLGSCFSNLCNNPELRVEAKVFYLSEDAEGRADFTKLTGADSLPDAAGAVQYLGSTTGPSFTNATCSPFQVTWNVRPECSALDFASLNTWCENNPFKEDHAHGVRTLVTPEELLAPIR